MGILPRFTANQRFLAALFLAVLLGGAAALASNGGVAISSGHELKEVKQQGWGYTLDIRDAKLDMVAVHYDVTSPSGIAAYAAAQRQENAQFFKSGAKAVKAASIVFNRALSWDEADGIVRQYGICSSGYDFYGLNRDNPDDIYSFAVGLIRDGSSTKATNDGMRERVDQKVKSSLGDRVTIKGIAAMQVNLTKEQYNAVSTDPNVYLIEMTNQIIKAEITQGSIPELRGVRVDDVDHVNVGSVVGTLYRNMARNHMMK